MPKKLSTEEITRFAAAYNKHGTIRAAAKQLGLTVGKAAHKRYQRALAADLIEQPGRAGPGPARRTKDELKPVVEGRVRAMGVEELDIPPEGRVRRYIFTCAQNNTHLNQVVWQNLLALAKHYEARVMVSRFVYDKRGQVGMDKDTFTKSRRGQADPSEVNWDDELTPYLSDERVIVAPGLAWCGEMNILPTAVRPLSGMESYTGRRSSIFPHTKLAMESVASGKTEATKFIYTTGTVTQRNYIQRKAGLKADFHHCYGGLLVEVDSDGDWFVRQLNADGNSAIYDLDLRVSDGKVTTGHRVEGINWGDVHRVRLEPAIEKINWWTPNSILKALRPRHQFFHDLLDFHARNHHEMKNAHTMFKRHVEQADNVEDEVRSTVKFLDVVARASGGGKLVVVDSNHDNALSRWLREADFKTDPLNAVFYLKAQLALYKAIERKDWGFHLLEWASGKYCSKDMNWVKFLREDESYVICPAAGGGIECGMHGHLGSNGARGGPAAFAKMGRKSNVGHTHQASIHDGVYTAGTSSRLDMEYNTGPSSWSHSHIVTYPNGKRAIITIWNGKWKAQ